MKHTLKTWELALLMALCITFSTGLWAERTQSALSEDLVRLHVIANSDSEADQAEKLRMRDRVLTLLAPLLADCGTVAEAAAVIEAHTGDLEALGNVTVTLTEEHYPTRHYDTFSLPAGNYLSLQIRLGEARGRNWWCVVFPPLCTEAVAEPAADVFAALPEDEAALITGDGDGYILRFRIVDWWGKLKGALAD